MSGLNFSREKAENKRLNLFMQQRPKTAHRNLAVRCFRGFAGDREARCEAIHKHLKIQTVPGLGSFEFEAQAFQTGRNRIDRDESRDALPAHLYERFLCLSTL